MGKIEEALRWTEKARAATSSDGLGELEVASRAWASAFLGWAYQAAVSEKKTQDAERLLARGRRLATNDSGLGAKLLLTWEHPELRPALWLKTSAGEVPAKNMTLLGVAEERATDTTEVEIRIDPEDAERVARLGAEVTLTAITNEGTSEQKVNSKRLRFGSPHLPRTTLRLRYENGSLHEESL
jgi:hypothetical protein